MSKKAFTPPLPPGAIEVFMVSRWLGTSSQIEGYYFDEAEADKVRFRANLSTTLGTKYRTQRKAALKMEGKWYIINVYAVNVQGDPRPILRQKLIGLYQQMADHTKPECGKCRVPNSCCSTMYCDFAEKLSKETEPDLPIPERNEQRMFLDAGGNCLMRPDLRPMCTLHTCDVNSIGFKKARTDLPKDVIEADRWTKKYFTLRNRIERLQQKADHLDEETVAKLEEDHQRDSEHDDKTS
jgi:hypothetical protein